MPSLSPACSINPSGWYSSCRLTRVEASLSRLLTLCTTATLNRSRTYHEEMDDRLSALIASLREDPEARSAVLKALLTDRFLDLPARVDSVDETLQQLVTAQLRTQEQLESLTQRVDGLTERMDG